MVIKFREVDLLFDKKVVVGTTYKQLFSEQLILCRTQINRFSNAYFGFKKIKALRLLQKDIASFLPNCNYISA
jgi:hypothetical protein